MEIQWLGHAAFRIGMAGTTILVDPFLTGNGSCPPDIEESFGKIDLIAVTHGHGDHVGDTVRLARDHDATVVAIAEVADWMMEQGIEKRHGMNFGGTATFGEVSISMVAAWHSSSIGSNGDKHYMGAAAGFVIKSGQWSVYHAGDTDIFSDMALIQRIHRPNVGLIPIGDNFTMGPETAALACNELLDLDVVVPMHFATFPVLVQDAEGFKGQVTRGAVKVLKPGETLTL
jgi:L-ascorbate metabolism protein UlaG (beta-lactamase superfamily)